MKGGLLHGMAPNAQRAFFVTVAFSAVAAAIYVFGVHPAGDALAKETGRRDELDASQRRMNADLRGAGAVRQSLDELDALMAPYMGALLEPLLESYAMRAKSLLDPLAFGAGLSRLDYAELPTRALPVPRPQPAQLHARRPIRITAQGSYMGAISFLLRVEKEHPLIALQSFALSTTADPERQQIEMVFEWPAKGGPQK